MHSNLYEINEIRWTALIETGSPRVPFRVWFFEGPSFADRDADDCFRGAKFFATREAAEQAVTAWEAGA